MNYFFVKKYKVCPFGFELKFIFDSLKGIPFLFWRSTMPSGVYVRSENQKQELRDRRHTEESKRKMSIHGHASKGGIRTKTYGAWSDLLSRCHNLNRKDYKNYGGRGISVCQRWRKFENFLVDMGECPEGLVFDRIDNSGNYEPGNCRWTDITTSSRNRRGIKLSMEKAREIRRLYSSGITQNQIAKTFNVDKTNISHVINKKTWNEIKADQL